jgi:hypothetical protein
MRAIGTDQSPISDGEGEIAVADGRAGQPRAPTQWIVLN